MVKATADAPAAPRYFSTADAFRHWLNTHGEQARELLVGLHKVGSGTPSMSWPQSVDEALCVGWIDGVRKRVDDQRYQIRFTPRKPGSIWSSVNIERMAVLIAEGRVAPAGLAAFARRIEAKSRVYAYEQADLASLSAAEDKAFRRQRKAWLFFAQQAPSYRKVCLHWVTQAKQAATRQRRLAQLIAASADRRRL